MNHSQNEVRPSGFTLVELAIVLMIIGLLIGGILKGQELITNARITAFIRQIKSYDAAVITFQDSYGAKPGDINNPTTRLPNCGSAPCSNSGNNNGVIGTDNAVSAENNSAWVHLSAANLISGIDPALYAADLTSALVPAMFGGLVYFVHYNLAASATYPNGVYGHHWVMRTPLAGGAAFSIPLNISSKIDFKIDNGQPWTGDVMIGSGSCGIASGATQYINTSDLCPLLIKAAF